MALPKGQGVIPLPPFKAWLASNIPAVYDNTLTYYEELVALIKYLQDTVVPAVNHNAEALTIVSNALEQLKQYVDDYFENLDVQEEINNKLDEMAAAGTLQEIITAYIQANVAWTFNSVTDMKSATNLIDGSYAQTLGYYEPNDGGAGLYHITTTGTADEGGIIAIGDTLKAHLIVNDKVTPEQFGAKGDGTTNDQPAINLALNYGASVLEFCKGKTYAIKGYEDGEAEGSSTGLYETTGIVVPSNRIVDLNFATIKIIPNSRQNYNAFTIAQVNHVTIKNGYILGDLGYHTGADGEFGYGIAIKTSSDIVIDNIKVTKCWGDGFNLHVHASALPEYQNKNILITNCIAEDNRRQGLSLLTGDGVIIENSKFIKTGVTAHTAPSAGIDIEPASSWVKNVKIINCELSNNYGSGLICDGSSSVIENIQIIGCKFVDNYATIAQTECYIDYVDKALIENCYFNNSVSLYKSITLRPYEEVTLRNNTLKNMRIAMFNVYNPYALFNIEGNTIDINEAFSSDPIIQTAGSNASNKCEVNILNNVLRNTSNNNLLNIKSWITTSYASGLRKIKIIGNTIKGGNNGITVDVPAVIHNNNFITTYGSPLSVAVTSKSDTITDIQNNIFEETTFNTAIAGVILTRAAYGYVIRNNTFYSSTLNDIDRIENPTNTPERFVQNTSTASIAVLENNNLL